MTTPIIHRKFVLNSLEDNSNKEWEITWYADSTMITSWGRVGTTTQSVTNTGVTAAKVENLIRSKINKGYQELDLHQPVVITSGRAKKAIDPKVMRLTELIMREAGERISSYLSVAVDTLSLNQINAGRTILKQIVDLQTAWQRKGYAASRNINKMTKNQRQQLLDLVKRFYNTIPTKLPSKIDTDQVVKDFMADLNEQENRLDQLEAGLASHAEIVTGRNPLGSVKIKVTAQNSKAYEHISDYVLRTCGGHVNIQDIYAIEIPTERKTFSGETTGKANVQSLFHGTRNPNVRHILRTGLIIPLTPSHGRRMGDGVYFSDRSQRSLAYCGGQGRERLLFVADVALGNVWSTAGTHTGKEAPAGFDSTRGTGTWSGHGDEYVVYRPSQQTIRYLVVIG